MLCLEIHTHTHPFNGPLSRTIQVSRYQKGKTNPDFTEARGSERHWHQLGHMQLCISLQTDNHASTSPLSFFTGQMPFLPPSQQRQSIEGKYVMCLAMRPNNCVSADSWVLMCVECRIQSSVGWRADAEGPRTRAGCGQLHRLHKGRVRRPVLTPIHQHLARCVSVCLAYQSARYNELYRRTYVLLRLLIPSFCLLALRSHNQRMDSSRVCYEQLGYGVVLTSRDWILHIVPLFFGEMGKLPRILP